MKNNRLHIIYNNSNLSAACNKKGKTISLRCTRLERARQIVHNTNQEVIEDAIFKDAEGNSYSWRDLRNSKSIPHQAQTSTHATKKKFIDRLINLIQRKKSEKFGKSGTEIKK